MKPFKWMFEEQNATEIEYNGKRISALYIVVQLSRHKFNLFIMNRYM